MSKTAWYWIGGVVVVVIVAGVIWHVAGKSSGSGMMMAQNQTSGTAQQSLQALMSSGSSKTCTFSETTPASSNGTASGTGSISTTGTVYVASGDMRGDFVATNSDGKVINSHLIVMNGTSYIWTDQMPEGFEMAWSAMASSTAMHQPGSVDVNQAVSYSCTPWVANQSEFTLPTNITFSTMAGMMGGMGADASGGTAASAGASAGGSASACGACANVPAAYQAQCRTAMHC